MSPSIAVLGAHTAVAQSLREAIEERSLEIEVHAYTSLNEIAEHIDPYSERTLDHDLVVLCHSGELERGLAEKAHQLKKPVLDLSDALRSEEKAAFPVLDPDLGTRLREEGARLRVALGLAGPLVAVSRALSPRELAVSTYESAAFFGKPGMDQLSSQVRSVFTMAETETSVLGERLAFNAIPHSPERDLELVTDVRAGLKDSGIHIFATRVLIPTFSSEGATLHMRFEKERAQDEVVALIKKARGLRYVEDPSFSVDDAKERDDALIGRISVSGAHASMFVAADRLRAGSVTPGVLAIEQWLLGYKH